MQAFLFSFLSYILAIFLSPLFIFKPQFSYHPPSLPLYLSSLANFDGIHYLDIATKGYDQNQQAFFPLYPSLIRFLSNFNLNPFFSGLLISNISFVLFLFFFTNFLNHLKFKHTPHTLLFYISFPTAFFLNCLYTESLFLFLLALYLFSLVKKKTLISFLSATLIALTRINGIFLVIPPILSILKSKKISLKNVFLLIAPILGLSFYSFYLYKTTGDPLMFFHSQSFFGASRSTQLILLPQVYWRYLKIFLTAKLNFTYFVSTLEFISFNFAFIILLIQFFKLPKQNLSKNIYFLALNLFSLANLILPTLTGTLLSIPRFILLTPSIFIFLSQLSPNPKKLILSIFFILKIILFSLFLRGYFIA